HPKPEVDIKCGVVPGVLDAFKIFDSGAFIALTLGRYNQWNDERERKSEASQQPIVHDGNVSGLICFHIVVRVGFLLAKAMPAAQPPDNICTVNAYHL